MEGERTDPFWLVACVTVVALSPRGARADPPPPSPMAASSAPGPRAAPAVLRPGQAVTLRIRQVIPPDGLSQGERLLNGCPPIQAGDHFLAEVIQPPCTPPALVGGTIVEVIPPGKFLRPGRLTLQMTQLVEMVDGTPRAIPWRLDATDDRYASPRARALLTALFGFEGAGIGAALGSQVSHGNPVWIGGGAGVGLIVGLAYAGLQRGKDAELEPGDTFQIVVGTASYRPVPRAARMILYPASEPPSRAKQSQP